MVKKISNKNEQKIAKNILNLLLKYGIKEYMSKYFNFKCTNKEINTIEIIFHKIIIKKFAKDYNFITTYKTQEEKQQENCKFKDKVFNTNDLMCSIFGFFELDENYVNDDLFNFSLVCSHWLFHVYNPNSINGVDLTRLMKKTSETIVAMDDTNSSDKNSIDHDYKPLS